MLHIISFFFVLLVASRDPGTGVNHWGSVKIPKHPVSRQYSKQDQERTYNVLVPNNMASSPKKIIGALAKDISKIKWPDSGKPMFNVTLMTEPKQKEFKKLSPTLHAIKLDYDLSSYFGPDGLNVLALKKHENRWSDYFINRKEMNEIS